MPKKHFSVMDIGSSRIMCAQGILNTDSESISLQYTLSMQTKGLQRARITNKHTFEKSILRTVHALEQSSKRKFQDIFVSFSSGHITSHMIKTQQHQKKTVSIKSIIQLSHSVLTHIPHDHQILHVIPLNYSVDGYDGVCDPRGMRCNILSGNFHVLTVPKKEIDPFMQTFYDCHLNVTACVATPFAAGIAASALDERNIGVVVIDIGADFTHISAFYKGQCIHATSLPMGGKHITHDISYVFGCSLDEAERIKRLHGSALPRAQTQTTVELSHAYNREDSSTIQVEVPQLINVIKARLEEIFFAAKTHLLNQNFLSHAFRRAIITGGAAHIPRIKDLAAQSLGVPVRIGTPTHIQHTLNSDELLNSTTTAGLLILKGQEHLQAHMLIQHKKPFLSRIKAFLSRTPSS